MLKFAVKGIYIVFGIQVFIFRPNFAQILNVKNNPLFPEPIVGFRPKLGLIK
jgi:hypothetical protein